ncbi:hypothetical protein OROMI_019727 [Orobanche minor]
MSKSKKQRPSIPIEACDSVSSLPDSFLCHILSFLPTKDTVATNILSKRWKPLWRSVFTLDFIDYSTFLHTAPLCCLVYSVMLSRDNTLPIRSFRLKYCFIYDQPNDITQLIIAAIQRRTETLELSMHFHALDMKLASNIFTCTTLTVVKLKHLTILEQIPQINNTISLLKTLHLDSVYFNTHTQLIDFLLSFPILEELQTNNVNVYPLREFVPKKADSIKCLPNLVTAKLSDNKPIPLFLLSRARSLCMKLTWTHYVQVPIFYNLTQMELFSTLEGKSWPKKWMWMLEMLQHSPKLQHLIIHEEEIENGIENGNDDVEDNWEDPKIFPECLASQLKTCLFKNYRGKKCELQFAEYVMHNSKVLSNMTIHSACSIDLNAKYQMLQKLSVCPRGCKLIFE